MVVWGGGGGVQYLGEGREGGCFQQEWQGLSFRIVLTPMSFPSPLMVPKHTSQEGLEIEALQLEAAQLGKQWQEAAKFLQNVHAALQNWAVQPQGGTHLGCLCQPAVCLLLGHSQAEL